MTTPAPRLMMILTTLGLLACAVATCTLQTGCSSPPSNSDPFQDVPWDQLPEEQPSGVLYKGEF